jgi:hypothetical protein
VPNMAGKFLLLTSFACCAALCLAQVENSPHQQKRVDLNVTTSAKRQLDKYLFADDEDLNISPDTESVKRHVKRQSDDDWFDGSGSLDRTTLDPLDSLGPWDSVTPVKPDETDTSEDPDDEESENDSSYPYYPHYPAKPKPPYQPAPSYPSYPSYPYYQKSYKRRPCAGYPSSYRYCKKTRRCYPCSSSPSYSP